VIAEAEALVKRSAARVTKASFIMRMRFLQGLYFACRNMPGGILVKCRDPTRPRPLNPAEAG